MTLTKEQRTKAIEWLADLPPHILREKIERGHKFGSGETFSDKSKIMEVLQQTACLAEMLLARLATPATTVDETERLRAAMPALETSAKALLEACYHADAAEELPFNIDGSLLDALSDALEWRHPAIWTDEQVAALNAYQAGPGHPFTCGGDRSDAAHVEYAETEGGDRGQLIATRRGWVCPVCDYRQNWAHEFMFNGAMPDPRAALQHKGEVSRG